MPHMTRGVMLWVGVAATLGCATSSSRGVEPSCCAPPPPSQPEPDESDATSTKAATAAVDCSHLSQEASVQQDFERGKYLVVSCDEACMKSPNGGKSRQEGLKLLKSAAERGHLGAQAVYGRTKFTDLMTTGTEPELEAEYVEAIALLSVAAKRGNTEAQSEIPQLESLSLNEDGSFSEPLTEPLSLLEEEWLRSALERSREALACFPMSE